MIICFDVDNTIVDTGKLFSEFAMSLPFVQDHFNTKEDLYNFTHSVYDISDYYFLNTEQKLELSNFWKCPELYDDLYATESAIETIKELKRLGHQVIFASHVEGYHSKSKFEMIKRSFDNFDGFIATREKQFVLCDYLIDDRSYNLTNLIVSKPIYVETRYFDEDSHKLDCPRVKMNNLQEILDIIK